jgi:5-methylcytosine-specific restriction endonuclease McrA
MSASHRRRLLEIVASDSTFEPIDLQGAPAWAGKCIHCNSRLVVLADGTPVGPVTVEHLAPTSGGGTAALENLALVCAGCNHEKGRRHDVGYGRTPPIGWRS